MQLYLLVVVLVVSAPALACTPFGRSLYAIGNNSTKENIDKYDF